MKNKLLDMIKEDVGFEDLTTCAIIDENHMSKAEILSRERGIFAGLSVVKTICELYDLQYDFLKKDGDLINSGDRLLTIEGLTRDILKVERTMLNLTMRMSGIATLTHNTLNKIRNLNDEIILASTRKTTPGLQIFEKEAVIIGGGDPHRFRLDDCVMIKDTHRDIVGDLRKAIFLAKKNVSFTKKIEVEVETIGDAKIAAKAGADIIMLDNMVPSEIKKVLSELITLNLRKNILIEVSGGITPNNVCNYVIDGVNVISMGFLTHSVKPLDLSLEII